MRIALMTLRWLLVPYLAWIFLAICVASMVGCAGQARGVGIFKGCGIYVLGAGVEATKEAIQQWEVDGEECTIFIGNNNETTDDTTDEPVADELRQLQGDDN